MDYIKTSLSFRIRKLLRYIKLYGVTRTLYKVKSAYHMARRYEELPNLHNKSSDSHVGIIGSGNFSYGTIAYYLRKNYGEVIRGAMDVDLNRAASLGHSYNASYYCDDADQLFQDDQIDLIYIASNHASHAEYAVSALSNNKHVHIEKPPVVNDDQLSRLCAAMETSTGTVNLGYNRPRSTLGKKAQNAVDAQEGPMMINWFIAAHQLEEDHWYFSEGEGGRVLGNLCHWIDYTLSIIPNQSRFPVKITPATTDGDFNGDFIVSYQFADGSLAVISMSAKGHTFEGVSERLSLHRGNLLLSMMDFHSLTIKADHSTSNYRPLFRDHGHEENIKRSYNNLKDGGGYTVKELWETCNLMLRTEEAVASGKVVTANGYSKRRITTEA